MRCSLGCAVRPSSVASTELMKVAAEILRREDSWLSADDVEVFCASCAEKMKKRNIKRVRASVVGKVLEESYGKKVEADKWETLPAGWTKESLKKFWDSLTAKSPKHKVTRCIKQMEGKIDDPGAFCASLADKVTPGWRSE